MRSLSGALRWPGLAQFLLRLPPILDQGEVEETLLLDLFRFTHKALPLVVVFDLRECFSAQIPSDTLGAKGVGATLGIATEEIPTFGAPTTASHVGSPTKIKYSLDIFFIGRCSSTIAVGFLIPN